MSMEIVTDFDKNQLYCAGSFTKLLTTYVSLATLKEEFNLTSAIDDIQFLDNLCESEEAKDFLKLFQRIIGSQFSIRDLCSYYSGLPYTFDVSENELIQVEAGQPFKHHSIMDEKTFLYFCEHKITPVYRNRCKFHYSEVGIIFLGYLIEKVFKTTMADLYNKYIIAPFKLSSTIFSRTRPLDVYTQDLSGHYDYPSIAILDHGYFCYSNGYYTTLNDMKKLIEHLLQTPVFQYMSDIKKARANSKRMLNGLAVELRLVGDDIIYGYEGLSFSGCNLWAYSTKKKKGYIAFSNDEEQIYEDVYTKQFNYTQFDPVPLYTEEAYEQFIHSYNPAICENKAIPDIFIGKYHRVKINEKELTNIFHLEKHTMIIRNPDEMHYEVVYVDGVYRIKNKDHVHGAKIGLYQAKSGHPYFCYDGTLYKKII